MPRTSGAPTTTSGNAGSSSPAMTIGGSGGSGPAKLQLRHTHTSAEPDQPIAPSFSSQRPAELSLPVTVPSESAWSQSHQAASQQRHKARESASRSRSRSPAFGFGDEQPDEDAADQDDTDAQPPSLARDQEDEEMAPFRAPTQVDSPEPAEQPQRAAMQQSPPSARPPAAPVLFDDAVRRWSSSDSGGASGSSGFGSLGLSQTGSGSLAYTSSASSSQLALSSSASHSQLSQSHSQWMAGSSPTHSQSQSQSQASPSGAQLTPPSSSGTSAVSDRMTTMFLGAQMSAAGASKVATHSSAQEQKPLPPLPPSRRIGEASKKLTVDQAKKDKAKGKITPSTSLLTPKSFVQRPPVPNFDGSLEQSKQPPQQLLSARSQTQIPFSQQKIQSTNPPLQPQKPPQAHLQPQSQASQHQPQQPQQSARLQQAPSSFFSSSLPASASSKTGPSPPRNGSASMSTNVTSRVGQKPRAELNTQRAARLEEYQRLYEELLLLKKTQHGPQRPDVEAYNQATLNTIMWANGIAYSNKKKEGCVDDVWPLVRDDMLMSPEEASRSAKAIRNTAPKKKRPPEESEPQQRSLASYATQPPEWGGADDAEQEEHDRDGGRWNSRLTAHSQPLEEFERPAKRMKPAESHQPTFTQQTLARESKQRDSAPIRAQATPAAPSQPRYTQPQMSFSHAPSRVAMQSLLDLHARSSAPQSNLAPLPAWVAPPPSFLPAPRYTRPPQPVSSFQLRVGVELVVIVPEYIRFNSTHRFSVDLLSQQFKSASMSLVAGTQQNLLDLSRGTGLVRAKLMAFVPVLEADYRLERRKTTAEWRGVYGKQPPSPWCVLTCRLEPELGQAPPSKPVLFTLYYLDTHWQPGGLHTTLTSWHRDQSTDLLHLATQNSAHYLMEAELFDAARQQDWTVKQLVRMKMVRQRVLSEEEEAGGMADDSTSGTRRMVHELVERVGRIIDIRSHAVDPVQVQSSGRSTYQCLQILWLKEGTDQAQPEAFVTDLSNQDVSCVSPWELYPPSENLTVAAWTPEVELNEGETDPLQCAISQTLSDIHEVVWSPLHLRENIRDAHHEFYARLMGTPCQWLVHIRREFVKVLSDHAHGVFTHWSQFIASMNHVRDLLIDSINTHADTSELESSDSIHPMIEMGQEQLPPVPDEHMQDVATGLPAVERRFLDEQRRMREWQEECPRAVLKVAAAFMAYINQRLQAEPTWEDSFGGLHISAPPNGQARVSSHARSPLLGRSYASVKELMQTTQ